MSKIKGIVSSCTFTPVIWETKHFQTYVHMKMTHPIYIYRVTFVNKNLLIVNSNIKQGKLIFSMENKIPKKSS